MTVFYYETVVEMCLPSHESQKKESVIAQTMKKKIEAEV